MHLLILFFMFFCQICLGQKPCNYTQQAEDSLGKYQVTKQVLMHERVFGSASTLIYFSLVKSNDLPSLNLQIISKSKDFIKANCFDKGSRVYFQLDNGKIIPLLHLDGEACAHALMTDDGYNNRILNSHFLFPIGSLDELQSASISLMRIKFSTETIDYVIKANFISEITQQDTAPASFFQDYLHCIFN